MVLRSERIVTPSGTVAGEVAIEDGRITAVSTGHGTASPTALQCLDSDGSSRATSTRTCTAGAGRSATPPIRMRLQAVAALPRPSTERPALLATTVAAPVEELIRRAGRDRALLGCTWPGYCLGCTSRGAVPEPGAARGPWTRRCSWHPNQVDPRAAAHGRQRHRTDDDPRSRAAGCRRARSGARTRTASCPRLATATRATPQTAEAVRAGAHAATHLFNGMRPFHHREPGVVGAALDMPEVSCELICDGVHVEPGRTSAGLSSQGQTPRCAW